MNKELEREISRAKRERLENTLALQIKAVGLYEPALQFRFHPERLWRFDFAFLADRLACEVQGGTWSGGRHTRGKGYDEDCRKANAAVILGWRILRFTGDMVESGEAVRVIEEALRGEEKSC